MTTLYRLFLSHPVVTTDTRSCPPGSIFFALRGASFNGNAFAHQALAAGCAYAVVDDETVTGDERLIHVPDALAALQQLAAEHRKALALPVLQITGTNGKTTTKELTAAVLARRFRVRYTQGNLNNHIGVPKTLLTLTPDDEIAVVETGANHPGEIAFLSRIVDADCGLITNVGKAHLEGFGSFEGVVRTKGELYDYLRAKPGTFVFLDADNPTLSAMTRELPTYTYGAPGSGARVEGELLACAPFLSLRWRVNQGDWHAVSTRLIGAYNLGNVMAAVAVGTHFGVSPDGIDAALEAYTPSNNRSELLRTERNTLIVDAYNANPTSMRAALANFAAMQHERKLAVLGEMRELGADSAEEHRRVAAQAMACGCREVWFVGESFRPYAAGGRFFPDVESVKAALAAGECPEGHLILVKGSNGTRLFELKPLL